MSLKNSSLTIIRNSLVPISIYKRYDVCVLWSVWVVLTQCTINFLRSFLYHGQYVNVWVNITVEHIYLDATQLVLSE